ncbi:MAG: Ig-like domain-containing protein, partial [Candidatus Riflebacteria bacterium]|nr:Ig-like domain-containing protein [Candidatus Riflebacteria bacterium]
VKSGSGSLSGSTYTPPTTADTAVLTCTFTENGVTKTADLTVTITAVAPTLTSISIDPNTGSVATNGTFDLAAIVVTATYSDSSTKTVTDHTWSVKSGGGSISDSTYAPPITVGTAVLTCSFTENGVTVASEIVLSVTESAPRFILGEDGVVTDNQTDLQWYTQSGAIKNWYQIRDLVRGWTVAGGGWRLPTIQELKSLYPEGKYYIPGQISWSNDVLDYGSPSNNDESYGSMAWGFDLINNNTISGYRETAYDNVGYVAVGVRSTKSVSVTWVNLNKTSTIMLINDSEILLPTITPANATNQNLTWYSTDSSIANVDSSGKVTGIKDGKAIIVVKTEDGHCTAECVVTVSAPMTPVAMANVPAGK